MVREINIRRHVAVLMIVALVFLIGIFIGIRQGVDAVSALSGDYETINTGSAMMDTLFLMQDSDIAPNESCSSYSYLFDRYNSDLSGFNAKMWEMETRLGKDDPSLMSLKDKFNTLEVRNYLLLKRIDALCGANHTVILYFYSNKNYDPNHDQGLSIQQAILPIRNRTVVYHFDIDTRSPAVDMLIRHYKIDVVPSIVVDGRAYSYYRDPEEVAAIIQGDDETGG